MAVISIKYHVGECRKSNDQSYCGENSRHPRCEKVPGCSESEFAACAQRCTETERCEDSFCCRRWHRNCAEILLRLLLQTQLQTEFIAKLFTLRKCIKEMF